MCNCIELFNKTKPQAIECEHLSEENIINVVEDEKDENSTPHLTWLLVHFETKYNKANWSINNIITKHFTNIEDLKEVILCIYFMNCEK